MLPRKGALMKGLVITTEDKMQVREFGEPAYETIGRLSADGSRSYTRRACPIRSAWLSTKRGCCTVCRSTCLAAFSTIPCATEIPFGDIVILKEGFTTPGERDFIGLDEDDVKFLGAMAVSLSGGGIKWESEAR